MDKANFEELISTIGVERSHLNRECPQRIVIKIAERIIDWKMLGYVLGLPREKITAIDHESKTEDQCKIAIFIEWKSYNGSEATYLKLAEALYDRHRVDMVEMLCDLFKKGVGQDTTRTEISSVPPLELPKELSNAGAGT